MEQKCQHQSSGFSASYAVPKGDPLISYLEVPDRPEFIIRDKGPKILARFYVKDGVLCAEYEPDDLDEAARIFAETVVKIDLGSKR